MWDYGEGDGCQSRSGTQRLLWPHQGGRPSQLVTSAKGWRKMSDRHRTYLGGVRGMWGDKGARVRQGEARASAAWTETRGHLPVPL